MKLLEGKVALVTGASRGIGKSIALIFAKHGAKVALNFKENELEMEEVLREVKNYSSESFIVRADVKNSEDVEKMFSEIKNRLGTLNILVNNAGILKNNLILDTSEKDWDDVLNTNLKGTFNCLKQAAKAMMLRGGKIINITSIVGINGNAGQASYASSKAGIIGLTKSAAKELAEVGITVNAIAPGLTDTDMIKILSEDQRRKLINQTPLGRMGKPEEIAGVALFLASSLSSYVNGQVIGVDGGMMM